MRLLVLVISLVLSLLSLSLLLLLMMMMLLLLLLSLLLSSLLLRCHFFIFQQPLLLLCYYRNRLRKFVVSVSTYICRDGAFRRSSSTTVCWYGSSLLWLHVWFLPPFSFKISSRCPFPHPLLYILSKLLAF